MNRNLRIFPTPYEACGALAGVIIESINAVLDIRPICTVALSGGTSPGILFEILSNDYAFSADWSAVHFFWVDERCVPPEDSESNYGMAYRDLLSKIRIPALNIHRIIGENDPVKEALRYSEEIMDTVVERCMNYPRIDIIILGLGDDGHTASIFPGHEYLFSSERICVAAVHPVSGQSRVTITGTIINNAGKIFVLVTGSKKAKIIREIFGGGDDSGTYPGSFISPVDGESCWYLDNEAAAMLDDN